MFVTVHNYTIGSGTQVDVGREAQAFLGEVSAIPGFRAYFLVEAGDDSIASVSVFDTREGIEECDRRGAQFVEEKLAGYRVAKGEFGGGQVLASQVGPLSAAAAEAAESLPA